jgi:hypothetical protein
LLAVPSAQSTASKLASYTIATPATLAEAPKRSVGIGSKALARGGRIDFVNDDGSFVCVSFATL